MLLGHTQKAEVNLPVLCTHLEQVLDCTATEHVLQNLHVLQLVKGLHIGKASKYGAVKHAPARLFEAQCEQTRIHLWVMQIRNTRLRTFRRQLTCNLRMLLLRSNKQDKRKSTPFCQARLEKAILQTLAWCLQEGVQQDQYVSFDASGLFQSPTDEAFIMSYQCHKRKVILRLCGLAWHAKDCR